ncbi:hypothetical protein [Dictyobacter aurantiacus]|uniref:Uncharacterized protein n=1 Tax=Dictyobacter aurantiacus TaxID=1936993 RepID=A0A401ZGR3_9CHLR|nr:hypothetical protein [Dictyobacter aurantiacus]GCE06042.1 hypothetical protein KDAU_33710 [Dictyobacter aurantiacus]
MQHMEYRDGRAMLRKAGFTEVEIERLSRLRATYREAESPQLTPGTHSRRRWLEKAISKFSSLCFQLTYNGGIFWPYDHTTF